MRMLVKRVLLLMLVVVVAAAAGLAYLFVKYPDVPAAETITVRSTPEKVVCGQYLSKHVSGCVICDAERDWTKHAAPVVSSTYGRGGDSFYAYLRTQKPAVNR